MQLVRTSTARRLFVGVVVFNMGLVCLLVATWSVRSDNNNNKNNHNNATETCEEFSTYLHRRQVPLLCMFTTFKPNTAKIPVNIHVLLSKARFSLYPSWRPELTARVDGWPVSITHHHGPCWRVRVSTSRVDAPSTRPINSACGNARSSITRQHGPCNWRARVSASRVDGPCRLPVNSASGIPRPSTRPVETGLNVTCRCVTRKVFYRTELL